jgi:hypothetical protein
MIGWFGGELSSAWAAGEYECVYEEVQGICRKLSLPVWKEFGCF